MDGAIVYEQHKSTYYRASSLGICPTAFIFARQGHEEIIPKPMQEAYDAGHDNEPIILDRLRRKGFDIVGNQTAVFLPIADNPDNTHVRVVGHFDGFTKTF